MSFWFTSDLHFWHEKGIKYNDRPYKNVIDMNDCLVENWNKCVASDDTVFIMGDFCLAGVAKTSEIISRLKGYKVLIMGNHDYMNHKPKKFLKMGMNEVHTHLVWSYGDLKLNMSHFPYRTYELDRREFRDLPFECRLKDDGEFLVHGHVHRGWARSEKMINVGIDVRNYHPMSLKDVIDEVNNYLKEVTSGKETVL